MNNKLLTTKEAARYLGVSTGFLERDRWAGARIPFVQVGTRSVRYEKSAIDHFILSNRATSTTQVSTKKREKLILRRSKK